MVEFFRAGGFAMVFVLLFGGATIASAVQLFRRPSEHGVATTRALSASTAFSVLAGLCLNLAAVCAKVPANPEWAESPRMPLIVMTGIAEAFAPVILGFSLLSLAWLMTAAAVRRLA
ncbi:MAG: hypothetical protein AAGE52_00875 [Myxococcota bacterium]